jgi:cytochrome c peroxidase
MNASLPQAQLVVTRLSRFPRATACLTALLLAGSLASPAAAASADAELLATALIVFQPLPDQMPGAEHDTPAGIELGKALYFDTRLSENHSQSCNTCHRVDDNFAGMDNEPTSPGAFDKRGDRNSPTVYNAGFHLAQFWDGRAEDLVEQAKGPVLNPVEMAMPSEAVVVERLKAAPEYPQLFQKAFPGDAEPIHYHNMALAIAAFERTLISRDRFDDFLNGQQDALTRAEKRGLQLFLDSGCTACHNGPVIGATSYHKSGLVNPYEFEKDKGRFDATEDEDDLYKFKVPSLRNVALTYPYFHDGRVPDLNDAVKRMGWMQLGMEFPQTDIDLLVAFLNSLSGKGLKPVK